MGDYLTQFGPWNIKVKDYAGDLSCEWGTLRKDEWPDDSKQEYQCNKRLNNYERKILNSSKRRYLETTCDYFQYETDIPARYRKIIICGESIVSSSIFTHGSEDFFSNSSSDTSDGPIIWFFDAALHGLPEPKETSAESITWFFE